MNLLLFLPDSAFELFYLIFGIIIITRIRHIRNKVIYFLPVILFPFVYRYLLTYNSSELKELVKISYMIILLSFIGKSNGVKLVYVKSFFVINFIITLSQFFKIDYFEFITHFYIRDNHLVGLQWNSVRATGIFSDPASNGIVALFGFMYFTRTNQKTYYLMSLLVVLFSQSKTVYLAFFIYVFFSSSFKHKLMFGSLLIAVYYKFSYIIFKSFSQLETLIGGGLMTSSFRARLDNWQNIYFSWIESADNFLIGPGRSGFGSIVKKTSVVDSDYIYTLLNFGLIGLIAMFIAIMFFLKYSKRISAIAAISVLAVSLSPIFMPRTFLWFLVFNKKDVLDSS